MYHCLVDVPDAWVQPVSIAYNVGQLHVHHSSSNLYYMCGRTVETPNEGLIIIAPAMERCQY